MQPPALLSVPGPLGLCAIVPAGSQAKHGQVSTHFVCSAPG
jgi:hypothetical protein